MLLVTSEMVCSVVFVGGGGIVLFAMDFWKFDG